MNEVKYFIADDNIHSPFCFSTVIVILIASMFVFAGCGETTNVPDKVVVRKSKDSKNKEAQKDDTQPEETDKKDKESVLVEEDLSFAYTTVGKKDPFRSFFESAGEEDPEQKKLTPLQKIELEELSLVGVIIGAGPPYAMIQDAKGKGYVVTVGTLIGKNWGRISAITSQVVIVTEEYRDVTGKKVLNEFVLSMPSDEQKPLDEESIPETSKSRMPSKSIDWATENVNPKNSEKNNAENKSSNSGEDNSNAWPPQGKPQLESPQTKRGSQDEELEDLELSQ